MYNSFCISLKRKKGIDELKENKKKKYKSSPLFYIGHQRQTCFLAYHQAFYKS
jgi:hypothetical protein